MFKFLEDQEYRIGAFIASITGALIFTLIITLSFYNYYKDVSMAKLFFQLTTVNGTSGIFYQKINIEECNDARN
mgnify:FL=1